ncbi:MAG: hypothetical protein RMJ59_01070 [Candidatus Nitrosocaldus sp.]|nr:hypothetical protein [Candidatus Nitrosocaldus sp.]MCS7141312.1 hypothetical protein [Candidatus Nitrosocaldus sp.]MDW8000277.1 hypothetical protein [Candidatus Nitrosocaldus sp.]MDW8274956.1 hypothetical protein [Candidatus Nitrosocaldus sp.]
MEFTALAERIMASDNNIRSVCVLGIDGSMLHLLERDGYGRRRLPNGFFKQVAIEAEMYRILSDEYGDVRFTYVERARAKQLIVFGKGGMLVVSLEPSIDTSKALQVVDAVMKTVKAVTVSVSHDRQRVDR